jgi:hypothetical protein
MMQTAQYLTKYLPSKYDFEFCTSDDAVRVFLSGTQDASELTICHAYRIVLFKRED